MSAVSVFAIVLWDTRRDVAPSRCPGSSALAFVALHKRDRRQKLPARQILIGTYPVHSVLHSGRVARPTVHCPFEFDRVFQASRTRDRR